jgi:hypothetical protein
MRVVYFDSAHDVSRIQWTRESIRLQTERAQREAERQQTKVIATGPFEHAAIAQRPETGTQTQSTTYTQHSTYTVKRILV